MLSGNKLDAQLMGKEPAIDAISLLDTHAIARLFSWYSYMYDPTECTSWVHEYAEKVGWPVDELKRVPPIHYSPALVWLCRIANNGSKIDDYTRQRMATYVATAVTHAKPIGEALVKKPTTPESMCTMMGDIDELLDKQQPDIAPVLSKYRPSADFARRAKACYAKQVKEVEGYLSGDDPDLNEGFASLGKKGAKYLKSLLDAYVSAIDSYLVQQRGTRKVVKPRQKKQRSANELVKNLKFMAFHKELNVSSMDPVRIVGSLSLVVYNSKYRKLGIYVAKPNKTLSVKGTSIVDFDEELSVEKTLRKPEEQMKLVMSGGPVMVKKSFAGIKTSPSKLSGRISDVVLLIRADK